MTTTLFGERLRAWRKKRGLSQLDLAITAGTTPRHVSFVETGRSRPGRDVVLRLAEAMELTLRERNGLLVAAGLPPAFTESSYDDEALAPVRRVIDQVLRKHEPYPAWSFGPGFRLHDANRAARRFAPGLVELTPEQLVDAMCLAPPDAALGGGPNAAHQVVAALRHELFHHPHPDLPSLVQRAEAHAAKAPNGVAGPYEPVVCDTIRVDGQSVHTITTVMRFDKPSDVTMSELRVELMFPADEAAEHVFRRLAEADDS